jgi:hypothetical protein
VSMNLSQEQLHESRSAKSKCRFRIDFVEDYRDEFDMIESPPKDQPLLDEIVNEEKKVFRQFRSNYRRQRACCGLFRCCCDCFFEFYFSCLKNVLVGIFGILLVLPICIFSCVKNCLIAHCQLPKKEVDVSHLPYPFNPQAPPDPLIVEYVANRNALDVLRLRHYPARNEVGEIHGIRFEFTVNQMFAL